jgi:putative flavoprotein involved in K+ transport
MAEDILVIGAGPAGIASAYFLQQAGLSYRVIDKASNIASTWNSLYPSLRLNTSRFFSHLPGKRFPWHQGMFITARQYHRYLVEFVEEHRLNIHLGVEVYKAVPEGEGWRVITSEGAEWYPAVIAATGRFSAPYMPQIPGMEHFSGQIMHAQDYHGPDSFAGKSVMVVGNGPSGVDIVTELGNHPTVVGPALFSQRTGVVLRPRWPYGLPKHAWMILADYLPGAISTPLLRHIQGLQYRNLDRIGIKVPHTDGYSSAAGGTRGRELVRAVKAGKVKPVDGPACFNGPDVVLTDGSRHAVDVVILATGYHPALFNYLDIDVETDDKGWPVRLDEAHEGRREVQGYPGLYLVGVFYTGKGAMYNFNVEAKNAAGEIQQRLRAQQQV